MFLFFSTQNLSRWHLTKIKVKLDCETLHFQELQSLLGQCFRQDRTQKGKTAQDSIKKRLASMPTDDIHWEIFQSSGESFILQDGLELKKNIGTYSTEETPFRLGMIFLKRFLVSESPLRVQLRVILQNSLQRVKFSVLLHPIDNYKMQVTQESQPPTKRALKLGNLRSLLKEMPIMRKRSEVLEEKMVSIRLKSKTQSSFQENCTGATYKTESNSFDEISSESFQEDNAFQEKYTLLQKIGEGCNASVYKCIYKQTQRLYAVKKFKVQQEHILTLKRDFITLKELNHPSICRYKALYFDQNQRGAYLVMEYLPYPSLSEHQIESEEELRIIIRELFSAISCLHNKNICHRDIKPENILYNKKEKHIKLIDFGVSKKTYLRGVRRDMLTIIGTHFYLAPEVFLGGGYDERVDLWACGVTIFKIVQGITPFDSEYHSDAISRIINGQFSFNETKWSKYSKNLKSLVFRLLKKENERISLHEASKHIWLLESQIPKPPKLKKALSYSIHLNEFFHHEFKNNFKNATAKEEGSKMEEKPLFKSIKLLKSKNYELEESDDEDSIVSPAANRLKISCGTFSEFTFANCQEVFCMDEN